MSQSINRKRFEKTETQGAGPGEKYLSSVGWMPACSIERSLSVGSNLTGLINWCDDGEH